ncbi:MAG: xanthine dehydrogenase family protein subunit M [Elusimicrobiota bacterium]
MTEYITVNSVEDIKEKLYGRSAYYIAGGTDIMVEKKDSILSDRPWVDISGIDGIYGISEEDSFIRIGAMTTVSDIADSELIKEKAKALKDAASFLGSPLIRNLATIGGNIANCNPAADTIPALSALGAVLVLEKSGGSRMVPVDEFPTGPGRNILRENEIITAVKIPVSETSRSGFMKLGARRSLAISKISMALWWVRERGKIKDIRIAMGSVGPACIRALKTEEVLRGKEKTPEIVEEAAETIIYESTPIDDFRSTKSYRRQMAVVLFRRLMGR